MKKPDPTPKKRRATLGQAKAGTRNLLSFRPAAPAKTHGVHSFIATGELPAVEGVHEVEKEVSEIVAGVVSDLGGAEAITSAQKVILAGLRVSLTVQGLAELHLRRVGVVDRQTKKATALLGILATYINSARLSATALGLERRARNVTKTLEATMAEIAAREAGAAHEAE
jgi:hypothetical protein